MGRLYTLVIILHLSIVAKNILLQRSHNYGVWNYWQQKTPLLHIHMNATVGPGPPKFSLRATIDHQGPSIHSGHYSAPISCCKKHSIATITQLRSLELVTAKNSSTAYVVLYELTDTWFLDSNRRLGVWSLPWRWHILSIPLTTGRGIGVETCGLDDVFLSDDLCSRPEALC